MTDLWCGCCPRVQPGRSNRRKKHLIRQILRMRGPSVSTNDDDNTWCRMSTVFQILSSYELQPLHLLLQRVQIKGGDCVRVHPEVDEVTASILVSTFGSSADKGPVKWVPVICENHGFCINPYHLSGESNRGLVKNAQPVQLFSDDSLPPPPYTERKETSSEASTKAVYQCSTNSTTTNTKEITISNEGHGVTWCKLAYWEESRRVGDPKVVTQPTISVSGVASTPVSESSVIGSKRRRRFLRQQDDLQVGDARSSDLIEECSLSLPSIFSQNENPPDSVLKIREKIGRGLILEKSHGEVFLYNVSAVPVFASSTTLDEDACHSTPFSIYKLPPGSHVKVFDYANCQKLLHKLKASSSYGPIDPYALRISFGKGWGANYSRQDVMSCPSWLEVCLEPPSRRNAMQSKMKNSQS